MVKRSKGFYITLWGLLGLFIFGGLVYATVTVNTNGIFSMGNKSYARPDNVVVCRASNIVDDSVKNVQCDIVCPSTSINCTSYIQQGIDNIFNKYGGGQVKLGCGIYPMGGTIKVHSNIDLIGSGRCTTLKTNANYQYATVSADKVESDSLTGARTVNIRVADLNIDGNKDSGMPHDNNDIYIIYADGVSIDNVYGYNSTGTSIFMEESKNIKIINSFVDNDELWGIGTHNTDGIYISNSKVINSFEGFNIYHSNNAILDGNFAYNNSVVGLSISVSNNVIATNNNLLNNTGMFNTTWFNASSRTEGIDIDYDGNASYKSNNIILTNNMIVDNSSLMEYGIRINPNSYSAVEECNNVIIGYSTSDILGTPTWRCFKSTDGVYKITNQKLLLQNNNVAEIPLTINITSSGQVGLLVTSNNVNSSGILVKATDGSKANNIVDFADIYGNSAFHIDQGYNITIRSQRRICMDGPTNCDHWLIYNGSCIIASGSGNTGNCL